MKSKKILILMYLILFHFSSYSESILTFSEVRQTGSLSKSFLEKIKILFDLSCFVETGTAGGGTTVRAAEVFDNVYTIELDEDLYSRNRLTFSKYSNIHAYLGDSSKVLKEILALIESDACLFFLDAHHDGGSGPRLECITPILKEIEEIVKKRSKNVIIIDDLRLFQRAELIQRQAIVYPELKNLLEGYCSIIEIKNVLQRFNTSYEFLIFGDIGLIYPKDMYGSIKPSNLLVGMTKSRFFEEINHPSFEEILEVLHAERCIIQDAIAEEKSAIFSLLNPLEARYHPELYSIHYLLWNALIYGEIGDFKKAQSLLNTIKELGMTDWRIQMYSNFIAGKTNFRIN